VIPSARRARRSVRTLLHAALLVGGSVVGFQDGGAQDVRPGIRVPGFPYDAGASFLAATQRLDLRRLTLAVDGALASPARRPVALGGGVLAGWSLLPAMGLSLFGRLRAYGAGAEATDPFRGTEAGGVLRLTRSTLEAWVSWTLVRPGGALPGRSSKRSVAGVRWSPGASAVGLVLSGTAFRDSTAFPHDTVFVVAGYPFTSHRQRVAVAGFRYLDAEAVADVALGPASLGAALGGRVGDTRVAGEAWGRLFATVSLPVPGLGVQLSGGVRPAVPERSLPRARFVALGLSWIPWGHVSLAASPAALARAKLREGTAPVLEVSGEADGSTRTLVLRNVSAASVALMGDFTDWEPLPLSPTGDGSWSAPAHLRSGTYHYLLSLDGGPWSVPEGLPTARGDFGREIGVLVVREAGD
jgi:hypothetical protein